MSDIHIDRKVLSDLQEVMEGEYLNLLETFLKDSEDRLRQLYKARTVEELRLVAHSFKGSSSNMGALGLAELCRQVEEQLKQGPPCGIEHLINQIDREYSVVKQLYRAERERVLVG
ncbi:Hpt domain-containing protein [Pseudomonas sp. zfem002]|uniref:Hpt domain-containing protein n=1 Tax=Pseudomonas sp. zfem002 TaxID=3078197 RepID=UPI0029286E69|nr:Hpt domain-containing protein [Pseudomonas sp. zfem002]MDU9389205.1 Hpt domain-containing protein [Pseudomonas sp. zfem002]